jgi:hypothetical protein
MKGGQAFDIFIADFFDLFNRLVRELGGDRRHVAASCRRALAVLRAYPPLDDGEEILLEIAIEQFEDLSRKAGGG